MAATANSRDPMMLEEDKMTRIKQNILLCDYYQNKGQLPQKYLYEIQKLAHSTMPLMIEPAPKCQISADGAHIILGDWTNAPGSSTNSSASNGDNRGGKGGNV